MTKTKKLAFERKLNQNGTPNSKYVDLLEEDKPIAGQKFACLSFVSPENILKKKEIFYFKEFLNKWDINKSMEKYTQFLNFISYKYKLTFNDVMKDFEDFIKEEKETIIQSSSLEDDYKTFLDKHEEELEKTFNLEYNFQTSVRGLKVRGVFPTQEEAELRCKLLREVDPHHDILVGPVGVWMPWEPEAYKTGRVEYMEEELNQLMSEKLKNEAKAKQNFEQRLKETKKKAIEDNIKHAEKTGNLLTQTIDENGNLIGINNVNTQEEHLLEKNDITVADIRQELFEGENIVIDKNVDHGTNAFLEKMEQIKINSDKIEVKEKQS